MEILFYKVQKQKKIFYTVNEQNYVNGSNIFKQEYMSNNQVLLTGGTLDTLHSACCFVWCKFVNTQIPMGY
jgi:hypothetical protein